MKLPQHTQSQQTLPQGRCGFATGMLLVLLAWIGLAGQLASFQPLRLLLAVHRVSQEQSEGTEDNGSDKKIERLEKEGSGERKGWDAYTAAGDGSHDGDVQLYYALPATPVLFISPLAVCRQVVQPVAAQTAPEGYGRRLLALACRYQI